MVAATVSCVVGVELFMAPPDMVVPEAGDIDCVEEPADMAPLVLADAVGVPPDGDMLPLEGAMAPELAGAIAPELAGAIAEVFDALSAADMAPSVVAGAAGSAGLLQAATDSAATPAARIIRVFMDVSQKRPPRPGWPAFLAHTIVSRSERT